ncbi:hypothetical protein RUA8715_02638 [Ruegeria arenilitoris]|uniref:Uncharacterized protein n=1 Tax=Ruegeria arenilitoris TaxID=1173585 RepID=A0A238KR07_9RHOB|nr:hypothetical protein RUA8715_02638 [Ruegeria arenilitoris]
MIGVNKLDQFNTQATARKLNEAIGRVMWILLWLANS